MTQRRGASPTAAGLISRHSFAILLMCLWLADPALGDEVHNTNTIVEGALCVSDHQVCANPATYNFEADLKVEDERVRIQFEDSSLVPGIPTRDWTIRINDPADGGAEYFAIEDAGDDGSGSTQVFRMDAGAPANSLRIDNSGKVGIGTATPAQEIHVASGNTPTLRLEQTASGGLTPQIYDIIANDSGFGIADVTNGAIPFSVKPGAPALSLFIGSNGNAGLGTNTPAFPLHIVRAAGTSIGDNVGFRLENSTAGSSWVFTGVEGNTDHFIINKLGSGMQEMRLNEGGDMMIPGTLTTGGPSCSGGCDSLFQPGYELESIEDHAASMWEQGHLPGVGPTKPGRPMNLSEKMGGLINELEKAHIYIQRLHEQLKEEQRRNDVLEARLARLESLLPAAAGD